MYKNHFAYPTKKVILIYFIWWLFWVLVQTLVLHRLGLNWDSAAIDASVTAALLAFFCFDLIAIFRYYQPGKSNVFYRFILVIVMAMLNAISFRWLMTHVFSEGVAHTDFIERSMPVRFILAFLILTFISLLSWMWSTLQDQKEQEKRRNETEQMVKEAELAKLRLQLQPHFLFNSLNSISALAVSKPQEARKMIQQLSDFLRGTLKKDDNKTVSLQEEIEHLNLYLEIEMVRFGHRLQVKMDLDKESLSLQIPPLILQPIVENAIKFGLYGTTDDIVITVKTYVQDSYLFVQVKNPFEAGQQSSGRGTGFGLSSIKRRLSLLYARPDLLLIEENENIFTSTIKIPQVKPNI